jgi:hypothetical protein
MFLASFPAGEVLSITLAVLALMFGLAYLHYQYTHMQRH